MKKLLIIGLTFFTLNVFAQNNTEPSKHSETDLKYRVSFPAIILGNIGEGGERTNTQHYELHIKKELDAKKKALLHEKKQGQRVEQKLATKLKKLEQAFSLSESRRNILEYE